MDDISAIASLVFQREVCGRGKNALSLGSHADPRSFKKLLGDGYDDENAQSQTDHRIENSHPSREQRGAGNHRKEGRPGKGFFQACKRRLAPGKKRSNSREKKEDKADRNVDFIKEGRRRL